MSQELSTPPEDPNFGRKQIRKIELRMMRGAQMEQAMQLRIAGASTNEIAKQLGIGGHTVYRLLRIGLQKSAKEYNDATALRALESLRLDQMQVALWRTKDDPLVAAALAKIHERRSKMWGLDAPEAMRLIPPTPPPTDIDVDKLTTDEAIFLRNILLRQQAERSAIDVKPEPVSESTPGT